MEENDLEKEQLQETPVEEQKKSIKKIGYRHLCLFGDHGIVYDRRRRICDLCLFRRGEWLQLRAMR